MPRINEILGATMAMVGLGGLAGWAESGGGLPQIALAMVLVIVGPWLLYQDPGTKKKSRRRCNAYDSK